MAAPKTDKITVAEIREAFSYDATTGEIRWRIRPSQRSRAGSIAGCLNPEGYWRVRFRGTHLRRSRIAWALMVGEWPIKELDHKNGVRSDDRFENLREATRAEDCQNLALRKDNTSGFVGVGWHIQTKKWQAYISVNNVRYPLGLFEDIENAKNAHLEAKSKMHTFQPVPRPNAKKPAPA